MIKKDLLKIIATAISVIGIMVTTIPAHADSDAVSTSMFVSPMIEKILLKPGETYEGAILVSNGNTALYNLDFTVEVGSYSQSKNDGSKDDYGAIDTVSKSNHNRIVDWIEINEKSGTVAPNETKTITYKIHTPKDSPSGAQYATILVTDNGKYDQENQPENTVMIQNKLQMGVTIFANIAGETIEDGIITENKIPSFLLNNNLTTESMVRNKGNVYTDAKYVLQVWPLFSNEEICTNEEAPETSLVLPDTERYHAQTCQLPSIGIFRAKQTVKIFGETSIVEKTIIVCPLWLLFLIIFAIIALIIWIVLRMRVHGKKSRPATSAE